MTAASLKEYTRKDLAQMAKRMGISGWHSMRKDQLVRSLARAARKSSGTRKSNGKRTAERKTPTRAKASTARAKGTSSRHQTNSGQSTKVAAKKSGKPQHRRTPTSEVSSSRSRRQENASPAKKKAAPESKAKKARVMRRIERANQQREGRKDLATDAGPVAQQTDNGRGKVKDRIVLMVRDSYWLQACWDISRRNIERAKAALAEHWHMAQPVLRIMQVKVGSTTNTAERFVRDIEIHGGVKNWYIDVNEPAKSYRISIGYRAGNRFYSLARSNVVTTPETGGDDSTDEHWSDIAENYEKVYALSGGYAENLDNTLLQELFEERLRRPMGKPAVTRYGNGAEKLLNRRRQFEFDVDAQLIVHGRTKPDAHLTLAGEPVKLQQDGSFTVRLRLPDRRQVLPVVAISGDGVEQRTIVLAVERNTKVMEPIVNESPD